MVKSKLSLDELITNAENNVVSRTAYIDNVIKQLLDTPLGCFVDRESIIPSNESMKSILHTLGLPDECLDNTLKDLICLLSAYYNSDDIRLVDRAREAIVILANLAAQISMYKYNY